MGGQPCFLKMLQDGPTIQQQAEILVDLIQLADVDIEGDVGYKIIKHMNDAENSMAKATRVLLESQGYHGPWPHALDLDIDDEDKKEVT